VHQQIEIVPLFICESVPERPEATVVITQKLAIHPPLIETICPLKSWSISAVALAIHPPLPGIVNPLNRWTIGAVALSIFEPELVTALVNMETVLHF
jgi:hypothetical protein